MHQKLFKEIVKRSLRIPTSPLYGLGNGHIITQQFDAALMSVGFKLSKEAFSYFSKLSFASVENSASNVLKAVQELVGDYVLHNAYFIDFPNNIPNTIDFWIECIMDALSNVESAGKVLVQLQTGVINLLDLPKYGKYQHSYEDLITAHEQFIPLMKDHITILHLGKTIAQEITALYYSLAESSIPLNVEDLKLLQELAKTCSMDRQPLSIPIRENKAIINQVRLYQKQSLLVDTPTDVLRLACLLSDGDVTLLENTKFKSFPRKIRRRLTQELDNIIRNSAAKLGDVNQYCEQWKRLGERLHVYEYTQWPYAQGVFAVARGDKKVHSITGQIENAFLARDINKSISLLSNFPGMLFRNLDRIIKSAFADEIETLIKAVSRVIPEVPTRIILSVKEHLHNRLVKKDKRVFVNKKGTVWATDETRAPFNDRNIEEIFGTFNKELLNRTKPIENLFVDKEILKVAVPLSDKGKVGGFTTMPRGSVTSITNDNLRFFIYWKQKEIVTDYDLSAIMLDENFQPISHLSYTEIKNCDGVHSGDLVEAPNGASEFIDLTLTKTKCHYIIPSINIYSGESFVDVDESFFGFMQIRPEQKGLPFEPTTVKAKFDVRGKGKVALPLVFIRDGNNWVAKWTNIYLNGMPNMNRVEANKQTTALLIKSIVERDYLNMNYIVTLLQQKVESFSWYQGQELKDVDTFVGIEAPEKISKGTKIYTLNNLQEILPV
jgi:stress response protein SCP2